MTWNQLLNLLAVSTMLAACASQPEELQTTAINPMPDIWRSLRDKIERLDQTHAPTVEWEKEAEVSEPVRSEALLSLLTQHLDLAPTERAALLKDHQKSHRTIHYGFEGNYHALVFFDEKDTSTRALLW